MSSSHNGWIGVDLDGTLAQYDGWKGVHHIGMPVPRMLQRVKQWLAEGKDVRIMTARVSHDGSAKRMLECQQAMVTIMSYCMEHLGRALPVTCTKDYAMIELWDDRAVQVVPNTGERADHFSNLQARVRPWMQACFGETISADTVERNHRFLEEALELVQACGATREDAMTLVDYVYNRPVGEPGQEVGGVMITIAALCLAQQLNMHTEGETELMRIWTKVEQIRAKQASKPKFGPLPGATNGS